ncbi:MAG: hypothetical protein ABI600_03175 [Luteolibacter sp.]
MKTIFIATAAALVLGACAPSTPQARIERNPQKFASLSRRDQSLIQQGQIAHGMSLDAVALAWGPPSQRFQGFKEQQSTERWDYAGSRPVYSTGFYGSYGYGGYGPYGRYSPLGYAGGPEIAYIPYRLASVWFVDNRVDSWERNQ